MKVSLENWVTEGKLIPHKASVEEIDRLFLVIERDIKDAEVEALSEDRRFATAYNAALQLATVALLVKGYRVSTGKGHHFYTLSSLPLTMGSSAQERADYFNVCRNLRNKTDYDQVGVTSLTEVLELIEEVKLFRKELKQWLPRN